MDAFIRRKSGGQPANQNARKHGFYSKALPQGRKHQFYQDLQENEIDHAIALLRVQLRSILAQDGENLPLILPILETIGHLFEIKARGR